MDKNSSDVAHEPVNTEDDGIVDTGVLYESRKVYDPHLVPAEEQDED